MWAFPRSPLERKKRRSEQRAWFSKTVFQASRRGSAPECQVCAMDSFIAYLSISSSTVVWVPDPNLLKIGSNEEEKPDQVLTTLEDFVPEDWGLPPYPSSL